MTNRFALRMTTFAVVLLSLVQIGRAQEDPTIEHARRILGMLRQEQFAQVAAEFNPQMAVVFSLEQLSEVWHALGAEVGVFVAVSDQRVGYTQGVIAVTLECEFERANVDMNVTFDEDDKISGLRFSPTQVGNSQPSVP